MKKLPFQQRGQLPITLKIRILKFWNPTACSVHSALHPITTQSLEGEGGSRTSFTVAGFMEALGSVLAKYFPFSVVWL